MSARFVGASVAKDLRRIARDPWAVLSWLGIPLLIGVLFSVAFGGDDGPSPRIALLVTDHDDSFVSGLLTGALGNEQFDLIDTEAVAEADGRARMGRGEASALLVIPEGFGAAVLREEPTTLELVTNPSERILPGIVEEVLSVLSDAVFYVHRVLGEEVRTLTAGPPGGRTTFDDATIAAISVRINGVVERLERYLSPPLIGLELAEDEETPAASGSADIGRLFLPGILIMALLFMSQGLAADLWQEREQRTLRRAVTTPRSSALLLGGKVLASTVVIAGVSAVALLIGAWAYDLRPDMLPLAIAWATLTGVMLLLLQMTIHVYARSARAASIVSMAVIFPLMMMGGSFFPFEMMPEWMASIGRLTPNGWALVRLKEMAWGEPRARDLIIGGAGLAGAAVLLFAVAAHRLRTRFAGA